MTPVAFLYSKMVIVMVMMMMIKMMVMMMIRFLSEKLQVTQMCATYTFWKMMLMSMMIMMMMDDTKGMGVTHV